MVYRRACKPLYFGHSKTEGMRTNLFGEIAQTMIAGAEFSSDRNIDIVYGEFGIDNYH